MNSLAAFLTGPLAERLGWALLHFVWEGAVVAVMLAVALRALRRRSATVRYRAGWIALVAMAGAIPLTAWFATPSPARVVAAENSRVGQAERSPTTGAPARFGGTSLRASHPAALPAPGTSTAAAEIQPAEAGASPAPLSHYLHAALPWVVGGWMIGAMLTALWHLGGWWQLRRLRRVGVREAPEEAQRLLAGLLQRFALRHAVKLVVSVEVAVPTLLGWLRPLVILPAAVLAELPPRQLEMILAHELAHLRRCDYLWNLVQTAIETLLFYHPAVWWVARQIRAEREMCCDQQAVATLGDRLGYARALAALAELCRRPPSLASAGLALGASGGSFSTRIRRLLGQPVRDRVALPAWLGGGLAVLLLLAAAVAGVTWAGDKGPQRPPANGQSAAAAITRGEAFLEDGELDQALAAFTEAIRLSPQDAKAYYSRACVDKRNGELDKFSADLAEAIRLDPKGARAFFDRGWAYGRNRDLDKAIADFTERIRLHQDVSGAYSGRGYFYMNKGDLDKAIADFTEAIRLNPGDLFAHLNRGCAYGEKGEFDKAIADSTEAIRAYAGFAAPYSNRAWAYAGRGELDKAIADAAEAIRLDAGDAEAFYTRGYAYAKKGARDKAQADYATAIRLEAGHSHETELRGLAGFLFGRETEFIMLPAYLNLCNPAFRKELHVTPEQEKKLRAISADRQAEDEKFARDLDKRLEKLPQDQREAETQRVWTRRLEELTAAGHKQIEEILTGQQLDAYKRRALAERAYQWTATCPDAFQTVGVTPEQLVKLRRLGAEINRQSDERSRQEHEALVAVLNAPQREKLHAEVQRVYRRRYEPADQGAGTSYVGGVSISGGRLELSVATMSDTFSGTIQDGAATPAAPADAAAAILNLPIYDWLGQPAVRKQLGFSAAQQKQLAEIGKKYARDNENLVEKAGKIPQADFVKLYQALPKDVAGRIEALLTRPQWAAVKDIMFRETAAEVLADGFVQEKIGLSRRQQAAVKDVFRAAAERTARAEREACEKVLAILTPQQQQKLRKEVDRGEVLSSGVTPGQQPAIAAPPEGQGEPAAPPAEPKPGKATKHAPAADGKSAAAALARGEALCKAGEFDKAIAAFTEAIRLDPKNPAAYIARGWSYGVKGDPDKEIADYTEAIQIDPKSAKAYRYRAVAESCRGDFDKALRDCAEVIRLNPKSAQPYLDRAAEYNSKGYLDKALADVAAAIRLEPKSAAAYRFRGQMYAERRRFDEAIRDCDTALALDPKGLTAYDVRGAAYLSKGDFDKAIADYNEAIRLDPKHAWRHVSRGFAYARNGERDKAEADYATAVRLGGAAILEAHLRSLLAEETGPVAEGIALPAMSCLTEAAFREGLNITPQQEEKLRAVSAKYQAELEKFDRDLNQRVAKLPPSQRDAERQRAYTPKIAEFQNTTRKQIGQILTAQQLDAYQRQASSQTVCQWMTTCPDAFHPVGVTPEQSGKLRQLGSQLNLRLDERSQQRHGELLAVLSAPQREKLRARVESVYRQGSEPPEPAAGTIVSDAATLNFDLSSGTLAAAPGSEPGTIYHSSVTQIGPRTLTLTLASGVATFSGVVQDADAVAFTGSAIISATPAAPTDAADARLYLPVYDWLGRPAVRKQLGMTAAQHKQLAEIDKKYQADNQDLMRKAEKTPQNDLGGSYLALTKDVAGRIEALLTRQQLATLKDIIFRETTADALADPFVEEMIGLDPRQKVALKDVFRAAAERSTRAEGEAYDKLLAILKPEQREKLRKQLSREGAL